LSRDTWNVGKFNFKPHCSYGELNVYIFRNQKYNKEISMFVCHYVILSSTFITADFLPSDKLVLQIAGNKIPKTSGDVMFVPNFVKIHFIPKQWVVRSL
jgi:hypothetical protein